MIQFNLLPDVKIEYIKAQKMRQTFTSISILVTIGAVAIFILSFGANQLEKKHLRDLNKDIATETQQLNGKKEINKILTVQNQLASLTALHQGKPAVPKLFPYLNQVTPDQVSITSLSVDFNAHTVSIVGTADSLSTVNKYVDTLKFTTYLSRDITIPDGVTCHNLSDKTFKLTDQQVGQLKQNCSDNNDASIYPKSMLDKPPKAFSGVVLSQFGLTAAVDNKPPTSSYTITLSYDPTIFDNTQAVNLTIPSIITTRSEVDKPSDLFTKAPVTQSTTQTPTTKGGQ